MFKPVYNQTSDMPVSILEIEENLLHQNAERTAYWGTIKVAACQGKWLSPLRDQHRHARLLRITRNDGIRNTFDCDRVALIGGPHMTSGTPKLGPDTTIIDGSVQKFKKLTA